MPRTLSGELASNRPSCVLFDRDGTLIHDVPYNGDPERVMVVEDAGSALLRLRGAGIRVGVVTNQSGIGKGLLRRAEVDAVNRRVESLLGRFEVWAVCPHDESGGCACRKPAPGLILGACAALAVDPCEVVVIGDIATDVQAAEAAGARGVLVPNERTDCHEIESRMTVFASLSDAVGAMLGETA